jgi:hypothetical protein
MTTATMNFSHAGTVATASRNVAKNQSRLSLAELFNVVSSTLAMARAVPKTGHVSAKQVAQMRALASAI